MGVTVTTAPTAEPISLDDAKSHLGISLSETGHDARLNHLITAARRVAEKYTRRALITQTLKLSIDYFSGQVIYLPRPPLQSVSSITYVDTNGDSQTVSSSIYNVHTTSDPGFVEVAYGQVWPTPRVQAQAVAINYVAGYGAEASYVPSEIKEGMILQVEWYFDGHGLAGDMCPAALNLFSIAQCGASHGFYGVTG